MSALPLDEYQRKRDFTKTAEPGGEDVPGGVADDPADGLSFVVHKHAARRLHYDLRLELDGVLLSWAVLKGPSLDPADKRLAMHVEDHPLEYGAFEGTIPEGEYGAGAVVLWDRGTWRPLEGGLEGARDALARGTLKFEIAGEKITGAWMLVKMKPRPKERGESWLLIKERDRYARPRDEYDVLVARPESVASGRTVEEVASAGPAAQDDPTPLPGPADAPVQLATLSAAPPEGGEWLHEIKYDGYRLRIGLSGGAARVHTRSGEEWGERFPELVEAASRLPVREALLDGEAVVFGKHGVPDFGALQEALSTGRTADVVYIAFDLLHLDGRDLRAEPLVERKRILRDLLDRAGRVGPIRFADHVAGSGPDFLAAIAEKLDRLAAPGPPEPLAGDPPSVRGRKVRWVRPELVAEIEFAEWTAAGVLRQPRFLGLREDRDPASVRREDPPGTAGITKADLVAYYRTVAPAMLPHLAERPLSIVRCPHGRGGECFFQKHPDTRGWPPQLPTFEVTERDGEPATYFYLEDAEGLAALVQLGALEVHAWNSLHDAHETPDRIVFDLDPGPDVTSGQVRDSAFTLRDALADLGLTGFVKTTGGAGLHVVTPIVPDPAVGYDTARAFARTLVDRIAAAEPERFTSKMAKSAREGRTFIDYLRNARGATAVAAFSTRARPGAPVAVPLTWDELAEGFAPSAFDTRTVPGRLADLAGADPWAGYEQARAELPLPEARP